MEEVEPGSKDLGIPRADFSRRKLTTQHVELLKASRELYERPLDGDCQVGGSPAWIQDPLELSCRSCEQPMVFVFRFSFPNPFEGCPEVALGSGALYYFACSRCERCSRVAQWT